MKNLKFYSLSILLVLSVLLKAQVKIGNNPTTINAGSLLELESTDKGLLFSRVSLTATTTWGLAGTAVAGMSIYNTNAAITGSIAYPAGGAGLYYFDGTGWVSKNAKMISALTEPWYNVATGTGATANTQNIYQMGNVGVGTLTPTNKLHVIDASDIQATFGGYAMGQLSVTPYNGSIAVGNVPAYRGVFQYDGTAASGAGVVSLDATFDNSASQLKFRMRTAGTPVDAMTILGSGYIGIGTNNPGAKLEVISTTSGTNTAIFRSQGAVSNGIYAEATGGGGGSAAWFNGLSNSNGLAAYALTGLGIYGQASGSYGIYGKTLSASFGGVIGFSGNNSIYGSLGHGNQYALLGVGDVLITGNLAKGSGTFKIDHPQDPENKYLIHSFVESPDMMNVYNGNVITDQTGSATVKLPDYFLALNKEFRYQLTAIGIFAQAIIAEEVNAANEFKIKTDKPNVKISWQVTGIRQDAYANAHRIKDVVEKKGEEKGKYIHPELFNQPAAKGIYYKQPQAPLDVIKRN